MKQVHVTTYFYKVGWYYKLTLENKFLYIIIFPLIIRK